MDIKNFRFSTYRAAPQTGTPNPPQPAQRLSLVRTFVETGDERCPIAGIWSRLIETDAAADDPDLIRPAMGYLLHWRAFFYSLLIPPRYDKPSLN
ncbi:MAG TPA: hypothetical protein VIJ65_07375 [Acidobacteriaceae bacterium]